MIKIIIVVILGILLTEIPSAFAEKNTFKTLVIQNVWIKDNPFNHPMTAGYLTIHNTSNSDTKLIAVSSSIAERIEIHQMSMDNDIMKMRQLKDGLIIPANDITYLKPGDFHLMFFGLKKQMNPMETHLINLTFQNLGTVAVHALVKPSENGKRLNHEKHNH
ncbi:MAG: hypothetical protein CM15mP117_16890 [Alphaproteobacteria bacterium]|nr:MAG: hypothetical protein CM15mP117_16890 [Alphaproteobacteria bacterium]